MGRPSVIDANCLKQFQEERVSGACDGLYCNMVDVATSKGKIAIDDKGLARQEYFDCCRPSAVGMNLTDWIADMIVARAIILVAIDREVSNEVGRLGVPKKDQKWPGIAKGAGADTIITDDIDLFAPALKAAKSAQKDRAKERGGPVSKYLRKRHGIEVQTAKAFVMCQCGE